MNIGGLIILSSYLPFSYSDFSKHTFKNTSSLNIPLFWGHGKNDPLIAHRWGLASFNALKDDLQCVSKKHSLFISYPGLEHSVSEKEQLDLFHFLQSVIYSSTD